MCFAVKKIKAKTRLPVDTRKVHWHSRPALQCWGMCSVPSHIHRGAETAMKRMPLCARRNISAMTRFHLKREADVELLFSRNTFVFNTLKPFKSRFHKWSHSCPEHRGLYWLRRGTVFKTQKQVWLGWRLNYAACASGVRGSVSSKPLTFSWTELPFFIDTMFHISRCWLRMSAVLVLDIPQSLNKLHSVEESKYRSLLLSTDFLWEEIVSW